MERSVQRRTQHIGLPTACAVAYSHVAGQTPNPRDAAILNDVARALASLIPIFAPDPQAAVPKALPPGELIEGRFSLGAHAFITKSGTELRGLTVQRGDLWCAITILKSSGIRFPRPDKPANG